MQRASAHMVEWSTARRSLKSSLAHQMKYCPSTPSASASLMVSFESVQLACAAFTTCGAGQACTRPLAHNAPCGQGKHPTPREVGCGPAVDADSSQMEPVARCDCQTSGSLATVTHTLLLEAHLPAEATATKSRVSRKPPTHNAMSITAAESTMIALLSFLRHRAASRGGREAVSAMPAGCLSSLRPTSELPSLKITLFEGYGTDT